MFSENMCEKYSNPLYCYFDTTGLKTWSIISIILLLILYLLNFNKKVIHVFLCIIILNSIIGSLLFNILARNKIVEIFKLSHVSLSLLDMLIHIIPLILIFWFHKTPKLSISELIKAITIIGILFLLYNYIFDINQLYISLSIVKLPKYIVISLYLILFSLLLFFMNYY